MILIDHAGMEAAHAGVSIVDSFEIRVDDELVLRQLPRTVGLPGEREFFLKPALDGLGKAPAVLGGVNEVMEHFAGLHLEGAALLNVLVADGAGVVIFAHAHPLVGLVQVGMEGISHKVDHVR